MFNTHFDDEHFEMMGAELEDDCSDELVVERKLRGTGVVAVGLAIMGAMILKKRRG